MPAGERAPSVLPEMVCPNRRYFALINVGGRAERPSQAVRVQVHQERPAASTTMQNEAVGQDT